DCAETVFANSVNWSTFSDQKNWYIRRELHATDDRWRIRYDLQPERSWRTDTQYLIHHQPGTIHQFTDLWQGAATSAVPFENLKNKEVILKLAQFYRAVFRTTARATDERTAIYTILPPGTTATNSLLIEGTPEKRTNNITLSAVAVCNSFPFDW